VGTAHGGQGRERAGLEKGPLGKVGHLWTKESTLGHSGGRRTDKPRKRGLHFGRPPSESVREAENRSPLSNESRSILLLLVFGKDKLSAQEDRVIKEVAEGEAQGVKEKETRLSRGSWRT